jgi:hypothetical protein
VAKNNKLPPQSLRTKCQHGRRRNTCKECDGASFCEHNRIRSDCKECKALGVGGSGICEHGRLRPSCKDCKALGIGGASLCEHDKQRNKCRECGGNQICEHKRLRYVCKECGGRGICEHDQIRWTCRKCKSKAFCEHNRQRHFCSICDPQHTYKRYEKDTGRNLSFAITLEQFISIVALPCDFCGEDIEPRGIDRWDNKVGYEFENCRPCCKTCNFLKRAMDGPTFVDYCQRIAAHTEYVEMAGLMETL